MADIDKYCDALDRMSKGNGNQNKHIKPVAEPVIEPVIEEQIENPALAAAGETTDTLRSFILDTIKEQVITTKQQVKNQSEKVKDTAKKIADPKQRAKKVKLIEKQEAEAIAAVDRSAEGTIQSFAEQLKAGESTKKVANVIADDDKAPLKKDVEMTIDSKFQTEMANIRKLVATSSGGGTNAVQYKDGGTMNGNLNVEGTILSGGIDISSLFVTSTAASVGGSDVTALSANWEGTYTTVATSSANWEGTSTTVAANSGAWGGGSSLEILDEGGSLTSTASAINFVGAGVTATNVGAVQTVTITGLSGGGITGSGTAGTIPVWSDSSSLTDSLILSTDGTTLNAGADFYANSLNTTGVVTTSAISFDTDGTNQFIVSAGQLAWNATDNTLDLGVTANVTLQIGQEQLMPVKGGVDQTIRNGMAVYAGGVNGGSSLITVSAYSANTYFIDELFLVGVATEDLTSGGQGYITTFGRVRGVDGDEYSSGGIREDGTPVWNIGDILYVDPSLSARGTLTTVLPVAPNRENPIAFVTAAPNQSNITLTVRANGAHGYNLHDLHDISNDVHGAVDGSILSYNNSLSVWEPGLDLAVTSLSATGDIHTTGTYFSGGVDLLTVLAATGGGSATTYNTVSSLSASEITLTSIDGVVLVDSSAVATTVLLPSAATNNGTRYTIKKIDSSANTVTLSANTNIDSQGTFAINNQYDAIEVTSDNTQWWVI